MIKHIHLIGIGGAGMSAIADILLRLGYKVSGSDLVMSKTTNLLEKLGAKIYLGHSPAWVKSADVVVYSSAIPPDNPELQQARKNNILVVSRSDMLSELTHLKYSIAVAGSHGKTTTTAMIAKLLKEANKDPTVIVGGRMHDLDSCAYLGNGKYLVFETDESDGSFLKFRPIVEVVLNIDYEHLDYYKDFDRLKSAFLEFVNKTPFLLGTVIYCIDDVNLRELYAGVKRHKLTYGFSETAQLRAANISYKTYGSLFDVIYNNKFIERFEINVAGKHNILNALACTCVGLELNIDLGTIKHALFNFRGVERRLQIKAQINGIKIIDDYAHHPTEIKATLAAIRSMIKTRLYVIFQPHRYTRTALLYKELAESLHDADYLILTDIYSANEEKIENVSSELILNSIKKDKSKTKPKVELLPMNKIVEFIKDKLVPGDVVVTLGAGDIWKVGEELIKCLKN